MPPSTVSVSTNYTRQDFGMAPHPESDFPICPPGPAILSPFNNSGGQTTNNKKQKIDMAKHHTTSGGPRAAETKNTKTQPSILDRFNKHDIPPWVRGVKDLSRLNYDDEHQFFYETPADHAQGLTMSAADVEPESVRNRVDYDFGPYGQLSAVVIGDEAWCGLHGAGSIAGLRDWDLTGHLPEGMIHVRGAPGCLSPDGFRDLKGQGIPDFGIRLEALVPYVKERRRDDPRVLRMVQRAISEIYRDDQTIGRVASPPVVDLWGTVVRPLVRSRIPLHRLYNSTTGEIRAVVIGTQVWILAHDVANSILLDINVVLRMAGEARTLRIPNSKIQSACCPGRVGTYVRSDAVEKLIAALPCGDDCLASLRNWIEADLLNPANLLTRSGDVLASTLHLMLGYHLPFNIWRDQIEQKYWDVLEQCEGIVGQYREVVDYRIPVTHAHHIATKEGTFAGLLTARLLKVGGYFHGGPIHESADSALKRFRGLVPDRKGRVRVRKIWELLNESMPFAEWFAWRQRRCYGSDLSCDGMALISGTWCEQIWCLV
jgi:hypothetical protein